MHKNSKKILSLFIAIVLSCSCQEIIDIDLEQSETKLVIEGRLLDQQSFQRIRISESLNYYDTTEMKPFTDAQVRLLDGNNNFLTRFIYNEEDSSYLTLNSLALEVGNTYTLQIEANGELLEATGSIVENATLDSIYYLSDIELESIGQQSLGEGFFMFVNGRLNNQGTEYFKLDVTVNDTLRNSRGDFSNSVLSSEFFGKEFVALPVPGIFDAEDSVGLELYTLNEDMYQYYVEFINLLFNDGGVFSPPPVNPTSNIRNLTNPENKPLGYVQFSSVQRRSVVIKERQ